MTTPNEERRVDEETIAKPFDQTNGMMPDADGESDGTAASDTASAGERSDPLHAGDADDSTEGEATAAAAMSWKRSG